MMFKKILYLLTLLGLLTASCAAKSVESSAPGYQGEGFAPAAPLAEEQRLDIQSKTSGVGSAEPADVERMVVKNASLSLYVDQPPESVERITQMSEEMGGYVVSANVYQTTLDSGVKVPHASITIRVPAERLYEAMATIKAETKLPVITENISSQDVTGDYTDLESRLRNLEAAEKQLQGIMEKATKTEDVLSVFNQLTQVREQIEVIKGQMKYYEQSAALSSISVELFANAAAQPVTIGGWQLSDTAKQALRALQVTLKFLVRAAIWIVLLIIPVLIVVLAPPALVIWLVLRWRNRRKAQARLGAASSDNSQDQR